MKSESWIQVLVLHWVCFLEVLLLLLSLINERGGIYLFICYIYYLFAIFIHICSWKDGEREHTAITCFC